MLFLPIRITNRNIQRNILCFYHFLNGRLSPLLNLQNCIFIAYHKCLGALLPLYCMCWVVWPFSNGDEPFQLKACHRLTCDFSIPSHTSTVSQRVKIRRSNSCATSSQWRLLINRDGAASLMMSFYSCYKSRGEEPPPPTLVHSRNFGDKKSLLPACMS